MVDIAKQYHDKGFVVLENFLSDDECKEMYKAGKELADNLPDIRERAVFSTTESEKLHLVDDYFIDSNDKVRYFFENDALNPDGTLKIDRSIALNKVGHALHYLHPVFRKHTYSDRVKTICQELGLINPSVVQSMYIYKNPRVGGEVIAHQDATYLHTEPIPPVGFWFALQDATLQNGCLWISRGSHKFGLYKRLVRNSNRFPSLTYDNPLINYEGVDFDAVPVKKGTCIVIHGLVLHKSAHNYSDKSRHAYTFHVIEKHNNEYSKDNWLVEGSNAPFVSLYTTSPKI